MVFSVLNGGDTTYGILNAPKQLDIKKINENRKKVFLLPIDTRNKLFDIQEKTGMDFYLKGNPWIDGKITVSE